MENEMIVCGLIGDPVDHSVSPTLFNYYARSVNLKNYYHLKLRVDKTIPGELKKAVEGIKAFSMRGFNVTLPYKLKIIRYIDSMDKTAKQIGAVNVILNNNKKIFGYNTDGLGFIRSLETEIRKVRNTDKVVVIGAGGASRAMCSEIYQRTKKLVVINRSPKNGLALKKRLESWGGKGIKFFNLNEKNLKRSLLDADIICNATPMGMFPKEKKCIISGEVFRYLKKEKKSLKGVIFYDAIFNPYKTQFLVKAEKLGATILSGTGMMAFQAVEAFNIWTNKRVNKKTIKEAHKLIIGALKNANRKRTR